MVLFKWYYLFIFDFNFFFKYFKLAVVITVEKRVYGKLEKLKNDIVNLLEENTNFQTYLNKLKSENEKMNENLDETKRELERLKLYHQKLQSRKVDFKIKGDSKQISELNTMHRNLVVANEKFKKKHTTLRGELEKLNEELQQVLKENDRIKSSVEIISYFFNKL